MKRNSRNQSPIPRSSPSTQPNSVDPNSSSDNLVNSTPLFTNSTSHITAIGSTASLLNHPKRHLEHTSAFYEYFQALKSSAVLFSPKRMKQQLHYIDFKEAHDYLQDNKYIITGYRQGFSYAESWISLFRMHNETVRACRDENDW
jgi:hypothetical protein